jgi:acetylglutamate kinase
VKPVVVKFGGELLESPAGLEAIASTAARAAALGVSLVIVHGGGREIDAALEAAGIPKRQVDGLRVTDEATLQVVVGVLAGTINTRLVAALVTAGVAAVGLTGADAACGLSEPAPPHRAIDGRVVDLGRVGIPIKEGNLRILTTLSAERFVPVVASLGIGPDGRVLNVNADVLAGNLAERLRAGRLVVAGTTPGVLDEQGSSIDVLDPSAVDRLLASGTASAGMVAKLRSCVHAVAAGVERVVIVDGRDRAALEAAIWGDPPATATQMVSAVGAAEEQSAT